MESTDLKFGAVKHEIDPLDSRNKDNFLPHQELSEENTFSSDLCKAFNVPDNKSSKCSKLDSNYKINEECCQTDIVTEKENTKIDCEVDSNVNFNVRVLLEDCLTNRLLFSNIKAISNKDVISRTVTTLPLPTKSGFLDIDTHGKEQLKVNLDVHQR